MTWVQESNTMRWYDGQIVYTYSACGVQARDDVQFFAWELDPSLLQSATPGACDLIQ
jgi:hypothetical protein